MPDVPTPGLAGLLGGGAPAPSPAGPAPAPEAAEIPPEAEGAGEDIELAFSEFESAEDPDVRLEALRLIIEQVLSEG